MHSDQGKQGCQLGQLGAGRVTPKGISRYPRGYVGGTRGGIVTEGRDRCASGGAWDELGPAPLPLRGGRGVAGGGDARRWGESAGRGLHGGCAPHIFGAMFALRSQAHAHRTTYTEPPNYAQEARSSRSFHPDSP